MKPIASTAGSPVFRELSGPEMAEIHAYDFEEAVLGLIASGKLREKFLEHLEKTGRYGAGACFPVVAVASLFRVKVYTSVEAAQSREAMPPARAHEFEVIDGEPRPDSELILDEQVKSSRIIGTDVSNAVDKARKEAGITPLIPKRDGHGVVVNSPDEHTARKADYADRLTKTRQKAKENREKLANDEQAAKEKSALSPNA